MIAGQNTMADTGAPVKVRTTTPATFRQDVLVPSARLPVMVDFWAPWCAPCRQLTPILEKIVAASEGKIALVTMNIEEHPQIAQQLGISSLPAVIVFERGQPTDGFVGALPESQVRQFVERLVGPLPDDDKQTLEAAAQALTDGDGTQAATLFGAILARDPGHVQATGGLVRALVLIGDLEKARTMLAELSPEVLRSPALVAARTALDLADQAVALGDTADLHRKIAQNGDDHQARLDLALALNAKGQRSEAAALLLEIIRRDRAWNDGAARTQLLQLFEAWGVMDPHTVAARKTLSTLIFS